MTLEEFMRTSIYECADCIEYVDLHGEELKEDDSLNRIVRDYHALDGGCLEIVLE